MSDVVSDRNRITVVGAGFSGLVAAWSLNREGFDVTVVDTATRSGGLIESLPSSYGLVETAANGLLSSELVEELFSDCDVAIQTPKRSSQRRYLCVDSEVTRYPLSLFETLAVIPKLMRIKRARPKPFETLEAWGQRALGRALTDKVLGVVTLGVYGCDARELSANLLLGRFFDLTRQRPRRGRRTGTVSARGGLEVLLKALRTKLEIRKVNFAMGSSASETFSKLGSEETSTIILATPAWKAADLLKVLNPGDERIQALSNVRSVPLVSVTMFFDKAPPRRGFGTLFSQNPSCGESDGILGCLQNSEIFEGRAKDGVHSETWILGGPQHGAELLQRDDEKLKTLILRKRDRWIDSGSAANVLETVVTRWPQAIPHYSTELEQSLTVLKKDQSGILLFGNYLGDLGLASILESTRRLGARIRADLDRGSGE